MSIFSLASENNFFLLMTMLLFYQSSSINQSSTHRRTSFEDFKSLKIIFVLFLSASLKNILLMITVLLSKRLPPLGQHAIIHTMIIIFMAKKQLSDSWIINFLVT